MYLHKVFKCEIVLKIFIAQIQIKINIKFGLPIIKINLNKKFPSNGWASKKWNIKLRSINDTSTTNH